MATVTCSIAALEGWTAAEAVTVAHHELAWVTRAQPYLIITGAKVETERRLQLSHALRRPTLLHEAHALALPYGAGINKRAGGCQISIALQGAVAA